MRDSIDKMISKAADQSINLRKHELHNLLDFLCWLLELWHFDLLFSRITVFDCGFT